MSEAEKEQRFAELDLMEDKPVFVCETLGEMKRPLYLYVEWYAQDFDIDHIMSHIVALLATDASQRQQMQEQGRIYKYLSGCVSLAQSTWKLMAKVRQRTELGFRVLATQF